MLAAADEVGRSLCAWAAPPPPPLVAASAATRRARAHRHDMLRSLPRSGEGGREMSLEKKSETKGRAAAAARFGGLGTEAPPHPTRGVEESYVDAPVLPRLVVECACTQRPKPTRGLLHMFFLLLLVYGIRPCLVPKKFCKIFQIFRHIESLDVCMEY